MSEDKDTLLTQVKPSKKNIPENEEIPEERVVGSIEDAIKCIGQEDPESASRTFFFNPGHTNFLTGVQKSESLNYQIDHQWKEDDFWSVDGHRFLFIDYEDLLADPNFQKREGDQSKFLDVLRMELSTASVTTSLKLMQGKLSRLKQEPISPDEKEKLKLSIDTVGKAVKESLFRATHLADTYSSFLNACETGVPSISIVNDNTKPIHDEISEVINKSLAKNGKGKWQLNETYQRVLEPQT